MADEHLDDNDTFEEAPSVADAGEAPPQYGVGPFSIREVALGGVWLVAFIVSFFSVNTVRFDSVWTSGLAWILTIGLPTIAVFLVFLRRLSPQGIRRVGSLGIDQFASVAFSVSAIVWLTYAWETVAFVIDGGPWLRSWVMWVELVLMVAGVVLTVVAPFLPVMGEDFRYRPEVVAHRSARPLRPIVARPAPAPRPAPVHEEQGPGDAGPAYGAPADYSGSYGSPYEPAPVTQQWASDQGARTADRGAPAAQEDYATSAYSPRTDPRTDPRTGEHAVADTAQRTADHTAAYAPATTETVRHQAFWALAPDERDVVDETGAPVWRIGPTAWALVIEDRGHVFVMRHEDGRIGYLHDVRDVTRG
ncbi:hypothetical protein [Microbacterium sp. BK668]|uniref:hypothetical protein n=1 Tax=Microbacterium sp. BK668 TaxID=2512118 RepID=UPI0010F32812|nr:hypothetical protein [Microbacterium sp. BK668]TDN93173.1 hypothetical protein EV279_2716 [Microbacterium sp. BK668]